MRRVAYLAVLAALAMGCGRDALERVPPADTGPGTTSVGPPTSAATSTTVEVPLLPPTSTTIVDPMIDPPAPVADPGPPAGRNSVMVIGDSVFMGTTVEIPLALPDWLVTYDAVGSRRLAQAIDVLAARRGEIGEAVVIHLGNNYIEGERGGYRSQIDEAMTVLADVPRVVWVTVAEVSDSRREVNRAIHDAATAWPNLLVADWAPIEASFPGLTWDGLHLTPDGRRAMATLVATTLGPVDEP